MNKMNYYISNFSKSYVIENYKNKTFYFGSTYFKLVGVGKMRRNLYGWLK